MSSRTEGDELSPDETSAEDRIDETSAEAPTDATSAQAPDTAGPAPLAVVSSWRRRVAALALLVGACVALGSLAPSWPHERTVELRVPAATSVRRVEVVWSRPGADEAVVKSSAWSFEAGAPASIVTEVDLPDGTYDVDIQVERVEGAATARRVITVGDADRIALPLP